MSSPLRAERSARHLLGIDDLGREGILEVLRHAESFEEVTQRPLPKVPALRGRTVATVFFENSTRTRLSFEMAAQRLSADTLTFHALSSSTHKGESFRDTLQTVDALGVDAIVVRHSSSGAAKAASKWVHAAVINAGDGQHEHPTQALLDVFTVRQALRSERNESVSDLTGLNISILGDVRHSRVARSGIAAFSALGARVTLVGPDALLPVCVEGWPIERTTTDLDGVLATTDICYVLRLQRERMAEAHIADLRAYRRDFGLTVDRARKLPMGAFIMHPGPMNRGIEIDSQVADQPNSLILQQVRNGVPVRMAVLFMLLGGSRPTGDEWDEQLG